MREISQYICEICGTSYSDRDEAIECEQSHKNMRGIVEKKYQPFTVDRSGYPLKICAEFTDGKRVWYKKVAE